MIYEVEIRYKFDNVAQIWKELPFLKTLSWKTELWRTYILGKSFFQSGQLLRIAEIISDNNQPKYYLGWKGIDIGSFANIREELGEDITNGVFNSVILTNLGIMPNTHETFKDVISILEQENFETFLDFSGENQVARDDSAGLHFKIMECNDIEYSVLMEIEKTTPHQTEVTILEDELLSFTKKNNLINQVIHDEPPALLYQAKLRKTRNLL